MRIAIALALSVLTAVPAVAHRRSHITIPLPKERIVKDVNTIQCVNDTIGCGNGVLTVADDMDVSGSTIRNRLGTWPSNSEVVPTKYTEEDISSLLRQNYDNMNNVYGWYDREVYDGTEPVSRVPVSSYTAVNHTEPTPNRRVSSSANTIILTLLLVCQALFLVIYDYYRRKPMIGFAHNNKTWRARCVNSVGLVGILIRQLFRHGMRTFRHLLTSLQVRLLLYRRTTQEALTS